MSKENNPMTPEENKYQERLEAMKNDEFLQWLRQEVLDCVGKDLGQMDYWTGRNSSAGMILQTYISMKYPLLPTTDNTTK
jgi:hypothetical protein